MRTYTCSGCGNSYTEKITANGHTIVIDKAVAPTCTKTGLTEGKHCSVCGTVLVKQEVIPMTEHSYTSKVTKQPTCTEEGVRTYTCSGCGNSYTGSIPMTAHNYVNGVCTMCGKPDESYATNGLVFTISNDGTYYSVTDYTGTATEVYIPSAYEGLPVTRIGGSAFQFCSNLTGITIPNSVTSIGDSAFYNCSGLTSITIPDSITSIGERVFLGCSSLTSIEIPDSVTSIGDYAFYGCSSLTSIKLPDSVTSIGDSAFYGCRSLTSITIPNSVTSIGERAFLGCSNLTSITIPDSVTSIGDLAFSNCSSLTSITIPDSVTSIGVSAFGGCSSLTSITIPSSVTSIGDEAFWDCSSLTSITIPDSVTSIGRYAFFGCYSLTSVTFEDPEGWYVSFYGATNGTDLASSDLSDPATAAEYLSDIYDFNYYWYKR